ncbi:MAG: mannosyltransferase family protein, partial [Thermoguttaceae bacterium]
MQFVSANPPETAVEESLGGGPRGDAPLETFRAWRCGAIAYSMSVAIVLAGIALGLYFLAPWNASHSPRHVPSTGVPFWDVFNEWDGQWYAQIAREGYTYDPDRMSAVAFFPLYPLLGRLVSEVTWLDESFALLLVAHIFLIGVCFLLGLYVRQRYPHSPRNLAAFVVVSFALYPIMFFAHMVYTESLFLFLCILAMYAMERKWRLAVIVPIIALATATRPVGIALVAPLLLHLWAQRKSVW